MSKRIIPAGRLNTDETVGDKHVGGMMPRESLTAVYGRVWDIAEFTAQFETLDVKAPYVTVRSRKTGVRGMLRFQSIPLYYFDYRLAPLDGDTLPMPPYIIDHGLPTTTTVPFAQQVGPAPVAEPGDRLDLDAIRRLANVGSPCTLLEAAGFEQFMCQRNDQIRFCRPGATLKAVINLKLPSYVLFFDSTDITNARNRQLWHVVRDRELFVKIIGIWNGLGADVVEVDPDDDTTVELDEFGDERDPEGSMYLDMTTQEVDKLTEALWYTGLSLCEGLVEIGLDPDMYDLTDVYNEVRDAELDECLKCGWWFLLSELSHNGECDCCIKKRHRAARGKSSVHPL